MTDLPTQDLAAFTIAAGKEDAWQAYIDSAKSDYSLGVLSFASRWAHILERNINVLCLIAGCEQTSDDFKVFTSRYIKENANKACSEADTDGITGGVEAAAVAILKRVWIYGAALNEWHRSKWGQS